jgi:hypothetical protein
MLSSSAAERKYRANSKKASKQTSMCLNIHSAMSTETLPTVSVNHIKIYLISLFKFNAFLSTQFIEFNIHPFCPTNRTQYIFFMNSQFILWMVINLLSVICFQELWFFYVSGKKTRTRMSVPMSQDMSLILNRLATSQPSSFQSCHTNPKGSMNAA